MNVNVTFQICNGNAKLMYVSSSAYTISVVYIVVSFSFVHMLLVPAEGPTL